MTDTAERTRPPAATSAELDQLAVSTLRFLSADMVEAARSGHPGMPLGAAPMAWALWSRHLRHDPSDPQWVDRDRFVLSAGHGSALLYALLHVFGYDLPAEELARFRQLGSRTPGHPEHGHTVGVETTTGPLGQGLATAVGMALAERMQAARHPDVVDHHTYAIVGDGCLMEGISHEAISLAGHLQLGRLVVLWDDNDVTIDGPARQSCSDDQLARLAASGWHVQSVDGGAGVDDPTAVDAVDAAIRAAKGDPRPSFIAVRTLIGRGASAVEGTSGAHGAPLGEAGIAQMRADAGWTWSPFEIPEEVREHCADLARLGRAEHDLWTERVEAMAQADPVRGAQWRRTQAGELPVAVDDALDAVALGRDQATRISSKDMLSALGAAMPELVGGSADLAGSTGVPTGAAAVGPGVYSGSVIHFGIREHAMAAALNGMALHGGLRVYGSTFLVFSDYLRPALRLAALMGLPVVYVLTHDSVAVGEDGPTHQPVEHVESLRVIPGVTVLRPADDLETREAWRLAMRRDDGPTVLVLTRQAVPSFADVETPDGFLADHGARVVREVTGRADVDLVASGSEVSAATRAAEILAAQGIQARVVSVPWRERFLPRRDAVLRAPLTVTVEAGVTSGWAEVAPGGCRLGVDDFGASGPGDAVLAHLGLDPDSIAARVAELAR